MKRLAWLCVLLLMSLQSWLYAFESTSEVSKKEITVGEPFDVSFTFQLNKDETLIPAGKEANVAPFTLLSYKIVPFKNVSNDGSSALTVVYQLTLYQTGDFPVPPFVVKVNETHKEARVENVDAKVSIHVKSVLGKENETLRDIRAPMEIPINPWWLALGILGCCALIGLILYLFKRWKTQKNNLRSAPLVPTISAWDEALKKLELLKESSAFRNLEQKKFFSEVSDILRAYLDRLYHCNALEKTTSELFRHMSLRKLDSDTKSELHHLLKLSDEVKFAKAMPSREDYEETIIRSISIVDKTSRPYQSVEPKS